MPKGLEMKGFNLHQRIKIINEELAYNKEFKQYRVLILQQPLDPKFKKKKKGGEDKCYSHLSSHASSAELKEFLYSFPQLTKVLAKLDQGICMFNSNYMVLPGYLNDAVSRLMSLCEEGVKDCMNNLDYKLTSDYKLKDILTAAVESYVMGGVHPKVYGVLCQHHLEEDQQLSTKLHQQLCHITSQDLKVSSDFICPLPSAVNALLELDGLSTPLEKLNCLKSVIDNISSGISSHLVQNKAPHLPALAEEPCLTSDDLIPLLVSVIAQASTKSPSSCRHLHGDISYMENFTLGSTTKDRDELSYCLVTFRAAVQYISSSDFSHLAHINPRKQNGVKKLTLATQSLSVSEEEAGSKNGLSSPDCSSYSTKHSPITVGGSSTSPPPSAESGSRLERRKSRVSKALEESSSLFTTEPARPEIKSIFGEKHSVPVFGSEIRPQMQGPEVLGDFLSALQDDLCDQTFGKQT